MCDAAESSGLLKWPGLLELLGLFFPPVLVIEAPLETGNPEVFGVELKIDEDGFLNINYMQ